MDHTDYKWTIGGRISRFLSRWDGWPVVEVGLGARPDAPSGQYWSIEKTWLCFYCRELNTVSWIVNICTDIHCGHCGEVNTVVLRGGKSRCPTT